MQGKEKLQQKQSELKKRPIDKDTENSWPLNPILFNKKP